MTNIAIISDIHADYHSLVQALEKIDALHCDLILCAGDVMGYGLFPEETIGELKARDIKCIKGNHDRWALSSSGWELSRESLQYLESLPDRLDIMREGIRIAVRHGTPSSDMDGIWPGSISPEELGFLLERVTADVLIVGHTHIPFMLYASGGGIVINPGAVYSDPKKKMLNEIWIFDNFTRKFIKKVFPPSGTFGILELPAKKFKVYSIKDGSELEIFGR